MGPQVAAPLFAVLLAAALLPKFGPDVTVPETVEPPAADQCLVEWPQTAEDTAACWIAAVFEPEDRDAALEVARWESGHGFSTTVRNPAPCANRGGKKGHATGLFQNCDLFWSEREPAARAWAETTHGLSLPEPLTITDGFHSTVMAAYLVYGTAGGWIHFHSCESSARWWRENRGVDGGGWVDC